MGEFRREVLPPRAAGGLTAPIVVMLATLMVTLTMAAMALVPRSQPRPRVHRITPVVPAAALRAIDVELAPAVPMTIEQVERCRAPVHRALSDGTVETTFELCAR